MRPIISLSIALSATSLVTGAEMEYCDLRLALGVTPPMTRTSEEVTGGAEFRTEKTGDPGTVFSLAFHGADIYQNGGLAWGFGLQKILIESKSLVAGENHMFDTIGPMLQLGYAYAFTDRCHIEAGGFFSAGWVKGTLQDQATLTEVDDGGYYMQGGARVGTFFAIRHLVLGAQVEYSHLGVDFKTVQSIGISQVGASGWGFGGQLVVGLRF